MRDTLFIIDDHEMVGKALKSYLDENSRWKVLGTVTSAEEALDFLSGLEESSLPEIVICDVQLKEEQSFDLIKKISENYPSVKIIVYSMFEITGYAMLAEECGALGYISKSSSEDEFLVCLDTVQGGSHYIQKEIAPKVKKAFDATQFLTKRERRVFEEIINGLTNEEISNKLEISLHSAEIYASRIYGKLGVAYREDLIRKFK
ncbi:MAG: response regulator transcription factor [Treponema sp.]|nr:response regulator transcription factor [Treponema sp.]